MVHLLPLMLERVGLLLIIVFLLSRMKSFRQIIRHEHRLKDKLLLIAIFGVFGIVSNYTGIKISGGLVATEPWQTAVDADSAIANTRVLGVALGGLLGGPLVGLGAGLVAGLHRMSLGGFTAYACGFSTIFAGIVTGLLGPRLRRAGKRMTGWAVVIGIVMECIQMGLILLFARPLDTALQLVEVIALPMIVINGFGTLLFMLFIQSILQEGERTSALQTYKALHIADLTLPYFRQGLNVRSSREVAAIMLRETTADAISITDRETVLAHAGAASDHHIPLQSLSTQLTRNVLEHGTLLKAKTREAIACEHEGCPLRAAIVLPLRVHGQTAGTLKLYFTDPLQMDLVEQELAEGLSRLFSTQLELAEAERLSRLLKDAEVKALQAQVHPHFLFNAINTISALVRTEPETARKLLLQLGVFFRSNLQGARQMLIPLRSELEHVEAYLTLEKARFPGRYDVRLDIDPELETVLVPPFTLQPLVENAVRHAFGPALKGKRPFRVSVRAVRDGERMRLETQDNGVGIAPERLSSIGSEPVESAAGTGTALHNIRTRIEEIYQGEASFEIISRPGEGTTVVLAVPVRSQAQTGGEPYVESLSRRG
ncbi:LytS/YhcK type 5TM receptor domain-containing protein [Paenibacillus pasadenensis]|uniref:histidine kinase n=1 Tax=Paenibacillus pasadenensis TaxID=217090 RepID=A0A2N5N1Q9_9BACL|nr:sensor histidine kinase [Paenibacillus pasadenensis]PLT44271.1 Autolysis histidine kinase LytS [Paenibacillus pasadenensis]